MTPIPMPKQWGIIHPDDMNRPILCEPTDRGNYKTFLYPATDGQTWIAPCDHYDTGTNRLVAFISKRPLPGEGLKVIVIGTNHVKTQPQKI